MEVSRSHAGGSPPLVFPGLCTLLASPQDHMQLKQSCLQQVEGSDWMLR